MSIFMSLYLVAYWLISKLKRKTEREVLYAGEEDYFVYRVSVWMCSVSMAVSIGSLTLLPFSVIGVELLQLYESNYYLQWLSYSLIGSLWNYVFTLSNLSLFVLLPFSYFFIESQGFSNARARDGITQRVYETLAICALFIVVLLCLAEIVLTIIKYPVSFLSITSVNLPLIYSCVSLGGAFLLLISAPYGFAKMFSFVREFFFENAENKTVGLNVEDEPIGTTLVSDDNRKDSDSGIESGSTDEMRFDSEEELRIVSSGDATSSKLRRRKRKHDYSQGVELERRNIKSVEEENVRNYHDYSNLNNYNPVRHRCFSEAKDCSKSLITEKMDMFEIQNRYSNNVSRNCFGDSSLLSHYYNGGPQKCTCPSEMYLHSSYSSPFISDLVVGSPIFASTPLGLAFNIENVDSNVRRLSDRRTKSDEHLWKPTAILTNAKKSSIFRRGIGKMRNVIRLSKDGKVVKLLMGLRFPIIVAILLVMTTIALMMVAINTLKLLFGYRSLPEYAQYIEVHTRHSFGLFGACIETLIIIYVMVISFVGLYSLPLLRSIRPIKNDTSMTAVIINSSLVLVASSALPVIVNTLGMTTFDLLGSYSSLQWLSSFRVVLAYNMMFLLISVAFLFNQLTSSMRREILKRLSQLRCRSWKKMEKSNILRSTNEKME